jgi:competence protein ComEC
MVLAVLLMPVLLVYRGNIIHNIVVIGVLWLYVVMSGASASLVRAALMFSILHLAQASSMRYNSLNTLSVALLAMLIYRPYYLYDISFQLSAMAVIGIVVWGVPLVRQLRGMHFVWHSLLATLIIGVVATLWTLPIVSNTFHAIPLIGVVATPVAMLSAYVIVCCGIFVLILPHPLATPFGWLAERAAWLQNSFVEWLSSADWITIDYRLSAGGVVAIYTIFLLITAVVWSKTKKNDNFVIR